MREKCVYRGVPANKIQDSEIADKARFVIEGSQVTRSHYCRTSSRRQYLPAGVHLADLYREFLKSLTEDEKKLSHTWFYTFCGTNYNLGTHKPKSDK